VPTAILQREPRVVDADETPLVFFATGQPAPHPLADRPAELAILPELPIQPRRRDLQIVRLLDQAGGVEDIAQLTTDALAILDAHAARFVDEHP
jgi:hypothetical protein